MKPQVCENCCGTEFLEEDDAFVCAYCDTRYPRVTRSRPVPAAVPVREPVSQLVRSTKEVTKKQGTEKSKWVSFFLCLFLGIYGAHKFYEGKIGVGLLYFLTGGLFFIGWFFDLIALLFKPNPYYV